MRTLKSWIFVLLVGVSTLQVLAAADRSTRQERKEAQAVQNEVAHKQAVAALEAQSFVMEADRLTTRRGNTVILSGSNNFVSVDGNEGVIQLAFNNGIAGYNGLGGLTVGGTITNVKSRTSRNGTITYEYSIQGGSVAATVVITLLSGSNVARAVVSAITTGDRFTFSGQLVPSSQARGYRANPGQIVPRGLR